MTFANFTEPLTPEEAEVAVLEAYIRGAHDGIDFAVRMARIVAAEDPENGALALLVEELPGAKAMLERQIREVLADPAKVAALKEQAARVAEKGSAE